MRWKQVCAALTFALLLPVCQQALAQEPADQDKLGKGATEKQKPLPEATGPAPGEEKKAKPADFAGGDGTKPVEDAAGKGSGSGGRGRRGGGGAGGDAAGATDKLAYDFELPGADGKGVPLSSFKGKTLLVVNLGSKSSFNAQLPALEKLAEHYKDRGLVVIGVPSNEFGAAEPGTDAEIQKLYTGEDKVTFPVMAKSVLTGDLQLPLYGFLTKANGGPVHWNYTKFFIGKDGKVVARFDPAVTPDSVEMQAAVIEILDGRYKAPGTGDEKSTGRRGGGGMGAAN